MSKNNFATYKQKDYLPLFWVAVHAVLGILIVYVPFLAKIWSLVPVALGVYFTVITKNTSNEAALFAAYYVGLEIMLRMTGATITWEFAKYFVMFILFVGIIVERPFYKWTAWWVILLLILLIPGILLTFTWSDTIKNDILFNESGIFALCISSGYFYKRPLSFETLKRICSWVLLPLFSICFYVYIKTPDYNDMVFKTAANFDMTGGYGPNQIATVLGFGWAIILLYYVYGRRVTSYKVLDIALFAFLLFRALFSFSRGGNFTAILSLILFFSVCAIWGNKKVISPRSLVFISIFVVVSLLSVTIIDNITDGVFSNRFTGKTITGEQVEDVSSGRIDILEQEIELFKMYPLGVGAGGSAEYRGRELEDPMATHNEFGRLLSEHGIFGIVIILMITIIPILLFTKLRYIDNKAFLVLFYAFSLSTMMHSAMRIALPAFLYGLSLIYLYPPQNDSVRR